MSVYHTHDLVTLYHPSQRGTMTLQSQARSKISPKVTLLLRCINAIGRPVACMPSCALEEKDSSWHFRTLGRHGLMDGAWPAECTLDSAVSPSPGALCSHRWEHEVVCLQDLFCFSSIPLSSTSASPPFPVPDLLVETKDSKGQAFQPSSSN